MLVAALFPRKESTTVTLSRYHGATEFDEVSGNVLKRELIWTFLLFPGGSEVKRLPAMRETWVRFLGWEDPWRRKWQPTPVFLPGKSHGGRSLVGYNPWGGKESDTTE